MIVIMIYSARVRIIGVFAGFLVTTFVLLPWSLCGQSAGVISVAAGSRRGPVNRLVFGQNILAADNAYIFSSNTTDPNLIQRGDGFWDPARSGPVPSVLQESRSVGMSVLRYPGGCYAHNFDWRKSVGPAAKQSGWTFGLDEYLSLCRSIGAEPLITVSDYALPEDEMPANAAALVEYLNSPADAAHPWAMKRKQWGHPEPYHVKWFELGNESMHGNHRVVPHRQFSAVEYAAYANALATAMRRVDPSIKLGIVTVPGAGNDADTDWNRTVVHLAGRNADFVILHIYAPQVPTTGTSPALLMQAMLATPEHVAERLLQYHVMIRQQLGHDLPVAVTEYNGALNEAVFRLSYANALECADLLRVFLQPSANVALAAYWQFLNGPFGMLHTNESSPSGEPSTEAPALLLYQLWAQHFGSELVRVDVQSPRGTFPGLGSERPSFGTTSEPRQQLQIIDLNADGSLAGSLWPRLLNVQIQRQASSLTIHMHNLGHSIYPLLARIPRPAAPAGTPVQLSIQFDAKFTPEPGSDTAPLGLGLIDTRGWAATHSGIGVDDISTEWKHLAGTYTLDPQTASVDLSARLMAEGKNVSGTLQVNHLSITASTSGHDAAYPLLTGAASLSLDRRTLYLIAINKSANDPIRTTIHLDGFNASAARLWEVNGPSLDATSVTETKQGIAFPLTRAATLDHVFPAHSMTAIEFRRVK